MYIQALGEIDDRLSVAENKITPEGIINTVRTSDGYYEDLTNAENNAKAYAETKASEAEQAPKEYADTKTNAFETRLSTAETNIIQTQDDITLKADKSTTYTKTETDGKISSEIDTAKAEIQVTTDGITSSVNDLQQTVSQQGTSISSNASSINQLVGQISLKVEQSDIVNAINAIEVGGRNYI